MDTQPTEFMLYVGVMGLMEFTTELLLMAPPPPPPLLIATESEYDSFPDNMVTPSYPSYYQQVSINYRQQQHDTLSYHHSPHLGTNFLHKHTHQQQVPMGGVHTHYLLPAKE
jgi:hypothetical protein